MEALMGSRHRGTGPRLHRVRVGLVAVPASAAHASQFPSVEVESKGKNATPYFEIWSSGGNAIPAKPQKATFRQVNSSGTSSFLRK
jgi:hypothetical protein